MFEKHRYWTDCQATLVTCGFMHVSRSFACLFSGWNADELAWNLELGCTPSTNAFPHQKASIGKKIQHQT